MMFLWPGSTLMTVLRSSYQRCQSAAAMTEEEPVDAVGTDLANITLACTPSVAMREAKQRRGVGADIDSRSPMPSRCQPTRPPRNDVQTSSGLSRARELMSREPPDGTSIQSMRGLWQTAPRNSPLMSVLRLACSCTCRCTDARREKTDSSCTATALRSM